jgi:hypothetical protein
MRSLKSELAKLTDSSAHAMSRESHAPLTAVLGRVRVQSDATHSQLQRAAGTPSTISFFVKQRRRQKRVLSIIKLPSHVPVPSTPATSHAAHKTTQLAAAVRRCVCFWALALACACFLCIYEYVLYRCWTPVVTIYGYIGRYQYYSTATATTIPEPPIQV